ncbi:Nuclear inhibitor of protein phosphatase 1 [Trichoplax sp. H2]|uniref:FHA domain-containing protein n=1 Tax=Trichoplax adhaerens TaxID=10228 RepID=B3S2Q4_TRIAD|nr:hypothetical protein TRIADDRAFT_58109 [Trichoplax adhaerens]EDV23461.1 hypothetical protein TRIADDRAFT_58109 [Trichoplax adhaerens]RDD47846.1 Nuclear inhibitor of protein phosphatase 1 [Trichoplax sp. H2]|eukprot:XP_002114371.1 hypothetical protein TRIADDRAFT_58109 [Trichoplax adhaerens]
MAKFEPPKWAGKPTAGFHLDVMKNGTLVEKLIIDEKSYYLFGRNSENCDFPLNHESCSRVHSAIVFHKQLKRFFIMDLGSTHGTFLGSVRLEANKPQQLPVDSTILFGASTRCYVIREKPPTRVIPVGGDNSEDNAVKSLLSLPENDNELDDLTEYNTAHNKRISSLVIENDKSNDILMSGKRKHKARLKVQFGQEEIINPEDVDSSVGRFRNMVQSTVVPLKKQRTERNTFEGIAGADHYINLPINKHDQDDSNMMTGVGTGSYSIFSGLTSSIRLNPAPDVGPVIPDEVALPSVPIPAGNLPMNEVSASETLSTKKHKVYAKEAWPGKMGSGPLLVS